MGNSSDPQIRGWIKAGTRFKGKSDGGGLTLRYRETDSVPRWMLRYQLSGKARVVYMGSYADLSLADARKTAKELRARVALGHDVAAEKQDRKTAAVAKIEAERIIGRWKHPNIVRSRIERDIKPAIGNMALADVKPSHIDALLKAIVKRGAPTMATDVLRWLNACSTTPSSAR